MRPPKIPTACIVLLALSASGAEAAPRGRYQVRASSVTDTLTGLTWQKEVGPSPVTWDEANAYCSGLQLDAGGWRTPALKELLTLIDPHRLHPAIDSDAFPGTPSDQFWAASTDATLPNSSWMVNFEAGTSATLPRNTRCRVRCVR